MNKQRFFLTATEYTSPIGPVECYIDEVLLIGKVTYALKIRTAAEIFKRCDNIILAPRHYLCHLYPLDKWPLLQPIWANVYVLKQSATENDNITKDDLVLLGQVELYRRIKDALKSLEERVDRWVPSFYKGKKYEVEPHIIKQADFFLISNELVPPIGPVACFKKRVLDLEGSIKCLLVELMSEIEGLEKFKALILTPMALTKGVTPPPLNPIIEWPAAVFACRFNERIEIPEKDISAQQITLEFGGYICKEYNVAISILKG